MSHSRLPLLILFANDYDVRFLDVLDKGLERYRSFGYSKITFEGAFTEEKPKREHVENALYALEQEKAETMRYLVRAGVKQEILNRLEHLSFMELNRLCLSHVSSKASAYFARGILSLPYVRKMLSLVNKAERLGFSMEHIDNKDAFSSVVKADIDLEGLLETIDQTMDLRNQHFVTRLMKLHAQGHSCIAIHGMAHAPGMLALFRERQFANNILCYTLYSQEVARVIHSPMSLEAFGKEIDTVVPEDKLNVKVPIIHPSTEMFFANKVRAALGLDPESVSFQRCSNRELSALASTCRFWYSRVQPYLAKQKEKNKQATLSRS